MKKRFGIISFFVLLFIGFIINWNYSYYKGQEEAYIPIESKKEIAIPAEIGIFKGSEFSLDYANMPVDETHQRTLETYYDNRAFYGAPPYIPHPVSEKKTMGGKECLKCHQNGGFVAKFNAYTPITPHPNFVNCKQCHVSKETNSLFKGTNATKFDVPKIGVNNALLGSPPTIPHQLQLRENCLSCHAGPTAPKEIRVTHPERVNCRQCHVLNNKITEDIGIFIKKNNINE
jgi:cytochrome c-type protein NapB